MWQRAISGSGGGSGITSIIPDTSRLLGSITTASGSYTTTEDCIMAGKISSTSGGWAQIYKDSATQANQILGVNGSLVFGFTNENLTTVGKGGMFIPKGTTIVTRDRFTYDLRFYGISTS